MLRFDHYKLAHSARRIGHHKAVRVGHHCAYVGYLALSLQEHNPVVATLMAVVIVCHALEVIGASVAHEP